MKRILSTTAFIILIVAIAAVAVYALNGQPAAETAAAPAIVSGSASIQSDTLAPTAAQNYNVISIPLDAQQQFADAGYSFDSQGLADLVGPGVVQVLHWKNDTQTFQTFEPPFDPPFALEVGGIYRLLLDSSANPVVSFVGDVPPKSTEPGHITYDLYGDATCEYNVITVPLDRDDIVDSEDLANAITGTVQVLEWKADTQTYLTFEPPFDPPFPVKIGYPYRVCLDASAPAQWP